MIQKSQLMILIHLSYPCHDIITIRFSEESDCDAKEPAREAYPPISPAPSDDRGSDSAGSDGASTGEESGPPAATAAVDAVEGETSAAADSSAATAAEASSRRITLGFFASFAEFKMLVFLF